MFFSALMDQEIIGGIIDVDENGNIRGLPIGISTDD
jgi:hypothetical protein